MSRLTDDEFVLVWKSASSRKEVAKKCGMSGAAVGMRAQKLRELGVNLKFFTRGRPKKVVDVASLNTILES